MGNIVIERGRGMGRDVHILYACEYLFSLFLRLLGLTPVILTKCVRPTELLVWTDTPLTYFINPWALIGIFWLLGLDFQLWLSTKVRLKIMIVNLKMYLNIINVTCGAITFTQQQWELKQK